MLATGSPEQVRAAARQVLQNAPEQFILAADCTVPPHALGNLRAAIEEAHQYRQ